MAATLAPDTKASASDAFCAICQTSIAPAEDQTSCPACHAHYHADCWRENGGCAVYGCSEVPPTRKLSDVEIPVTYWGQEHKPCPSCGQTILAAALRCRHCGATFESARPLESAEFSRQEERKTRAPQLRNAAIVIMAVCLVPVLAPFGVLFGALWYRENKDDLRAVPTLYRALCLVGLGVGTLQTALSIVLVTLFAIVRTH